MLIAFVHSEKAFLPALQGYLDFFHQYKVKTIVCSKHDVPHLKPDVEWHFMGLDTHTRPDVIKIHDYSSASTPPLASLKNKLKFLVNTKPHYRLFPNQYVFEAFGFGDDVPFGFRDVGVTPFYENRHIGVKDFDFLYVGEIRGRCLEPLFDLFSTGALSNKTLLLLSRNYEIISRRLERYPNIQFRGPVPTHEVKNYIFRSRFGINYIPNKEPFNKQASTKFLEYAAGRLPVISTRYPWIENFQLQYGGKYFYLSDSLSNFTWDAINDFQYEFPDLSECTWDHQIRKSGVLELLSLKFPGVFATDFTD